MAGGALGALSPPGPAVEVPKTKPRKLSVHEFGIDAMQRDTVPVHSRIVARAERQTRKGKGVSGYNTSGRGYDIPVRDVPSPQSSARADGERVLLRAAFRTGRAAAAWRVAGREAHRQ